MQCSQQSSLCHILLYTGSVVGIFNSIWLMIVYSTSGTSEETEDINDGVVAVTVANVPSETPRLIATTLAAYVFFGYAMYLVLEEFEWFTEMRHKFLRQRKARNYTVFIRNIPEAYRSNEALQEFMRSCFSHEAVLKARMAVTVGHLSKLVANRDASLAKLEHAMAEWEISGKRPTHKDGMVGMGQVVDSIDTYTHELKELNEAVDTAITEVEGKIEAASANQDWNDQSHALRSESHDEVVSLMTHDIDSKVENSDTKKDGPSGGPITAVGGALGNVVGGAFGQVGNLASGAAALLASGEDGEAYPAGFVVFSKLATANAALQMVHHATPFSMEILEAPDPDDSTWLSTLMNLSTIASI
jgi:hypothetical protein